MPTPTDDLFHWPTRFLLAANDPAIFQLILQRFLNHQLPSLPEAVTTGSQVIREICSANHAGITLYKWQKFSQKRRDFARFCANFETQLQKFKKALEAHRLKELALTAQRQMALSELNQLAEKKGIQPILVKGAATALKFYPDFSLRPMNDFDVIIPKDQIEFFADREVSALSFQHIDVVNVKLSGIAAELHWCLNEKLAWGQYESFQHLKLPIPQFAQLQTLPDHILAVIALVHLVRHVGTSANDLIDLSFILSKADFDWASFETYLKENKLEKYAICGLMLMNQLCSDLAIPPQYLAAGPLMTHTQAQFFQAVSRYMGEPNHSVLKERWYYCKITGQNFIKDCLIRALGTMETTEKELIRLGKKNTRCNRVFFHYLYIPFRKTARLFGRNRWQD